MYRVSDFYLIFWWCLYTYAIFQLSTPSIIGLAFQDKEIKKNSVPHFEPPGQNFPGFIFFRLVWMILLQVCQISASHPIYKWFSFSRPTNKKIPSAILYPRVKIFWFSYFSFWSAKFQLSTSSRSGLAFLDKHTYIHFCIYIDSINVSVLKMMAVCSSEPWFLRISSRGICNRKTNNDILYPFPIIFSEKNWKTTLKKGSNRRLERNASPGAS
jgi:hypothetical protein